MQPTFAPSGLGPEEMPACPKGFRIWSLKHEWTSHEQFANFEEARLSVFRYIETFYNFERIHETLDYLSPDAYEADNDPAVVA